MATGSLKTREITVAAMTAAAYTVLTAVFAPVSFGPVQIRISEALTVLPGFYIASVPGLAAGCFLSNLLLGAPAADVIFGTLATLLAGVGTALLKKHPRLWALPPVLINMLVIPFVLKYAYGNSHVLPVLMVSVGAGELASAGILGNLLRITLTKTIFRSTSDAG